MKLDKRHLVASVALLVASIIYNVWVFTRPSRATVAANAAAADALAQAASVASPLPSGSTGPLAVDPAQITPLPDVEIDRLPEWPRDPFADQRPQEPVFAEAGVPEPVAVEDPDPVVASILYSASRRLATLDGRIVRVGDKIGNATVVDILPSAVIIESPERGRRTLTMRPPGSGFTPQ